MYACMAMVALAQSGCPRQTVACQRQLAYNSESPETGPPRLGQKVMRKRRHAVTRRLGRTSDCGALWSPTRAGETPLLVEDPPSDCATAPNYRNKTKFRPSVCLSAAHSSARPSVRPPNCPSVRPPVRPPACQAAHPSTHASNRALPRGSRRYILYVYVYIYI